MSWEQAIAGVFHFLRLDKIKRKILVFALVATLIPSLTTGWLSYTHNKRSLTEKITAELRNVSTHGAQETNLWRKERFYDLRVFSNSYEVSENLDRILGFQNGLDDDEVTVRRLRDYLTAVQERFTDYEELSVLDLERRVVASTGLPGELQLPNDWHRQVALGEQVQGEAYWDEALQQAIMVIAVPIIAPDGRFLGSVVAKTNFRTVDQTLRSFSVGETAHVYLLKDDGTILVSSRIDPARVTEEGLTPTTVESIFAHQATSFEYLSARRNWVVGTFERVPQQNWGVVAELATEEAFLPIAELRDQTLVMVSALLVSVGLVAWVLGLTIVRPLDRLTAGAAEVASGDLEVKLPVVTRGELGYLTRVFNDMVARLRQGRDELERLSVTDDLTGLYNRRHLERTLASEAARASRYDVPFSILMVDLDHFKEYNDCFGHLAGDKVLANMATIFTECLREVDYASRYGGEEFFIMLPQTDLKGALLVAERIRGRFVKEGFATEDEETTLTLSVGAAEFPRNGDTPEAIIDSADAALYEAKHAGRDRVVSATKGRTRKARRQAAPRRKKARKSAKAATAKSGKKKAGKRAATGRKKARKRTKATSGGPRKKAR